MKDVDEAIKDPGVINKLNYFDYQQKDYRKDQAHRLNRRLERINKNKISSKVFLLWGIIFSISFYLFVLSPGSIFDYIISGLIISSIFVMSFIDYSKYKTSIIKFNVDRDNLILLLESPEEKLSRLRLAKLEVILTDEEEILK